MLTHTISGSSQPTLVFLHWLGGTARSWKPLVERLQRHDVRCLCIDLPGFGDASEVAPADCMTMSQRIAETISHHVTGDEGYVLVGHSMGGKVAALHARMAEDSSDANKLRALILISPSPPSPEPMTDSKRTEVTQELGNARGSVAERNAYGRKFVEDNLGKLALDPLIEEAEVRHMMKSSPEAFAKWMQHSSKEDCRAIVGRLHTPTLLLAGSEDGALGPKAQQECTLPHFVNGHLITLQGAGHLAPLERPAEVALRLLRFLQSLGIRYVTAAELTPSFTEVLLSDATSEQTRRVMQERLQHHAPLPLFREDLSLTLQALIDHVLPSASPNLIARLEQSLSQKLGDGWRFDQLPADLEAWQSGLQTLDHAALKALGVNFAALPGTLQDELLQAIQAGRVGKGRLGKLHLGDEAMDLSSESMKLWFEEVRGQLAKLYASDPRTMDRIGFTGFADNHGFDLVEINATRTDR